MNKFVCAVLVMLTSVFISSVSQILLKKEAGKEHSHWLQEYLNLPVIVAYGMFFGSTLLTMFALKEIPLSMAPILESAGYIFVSVMGYLFLKEKFTKRKIAGLCLIFVGIFVFSL